LQQCKTSALPLVAERPGTAVLKTYMVFFKSPMFQQVSCGKDGINGVRKNTKQ
jgi:hypothetical protein